MMSLGLKVIQSGIYIRSVDLEWGTRLSSSECHASRESKDELKSKLHSYGHCGGGVSESGQSVCC